MKGKFGFLFGFCFCRWEHDEQYLLLSFIITYSWRHGIRNGNIYFTWPRCVCKVSSVTCFIVRLHMVLVCSFRMSDKSDCYKWILGQAEWLGCKGTAPSLDDWVCSLEPTSMIGENQGPQLVLGHTCSSVSIHYYIHLKYSRKTFELFSIIPSVLQW